MTRHVKVSKYHLKFAWNLTKTTFDIVILFEPKCLISWTPIKLFDIYVTWHQILSTIFVIRRRFSVIKLVNIDKHLLITNFRKRYILHKYHIGRQILSNYFDAPHIKCQIFAAILKWINYCPDIKTL